MFRRSTLWVLSDIWANRWLGARGRLRMLGGRLMRDPFLTLAGRFDLQASRGRPLPADVGRRGPVR